MKNVFATGIGALVLCCAFLATPALATPTGTIDAQDMVMPNGYLIITPYGSVSNPDWGQADISITDDVSMYTAASSYYHIVSPTGTFSVASGDTKPYSETFYFTYLGPGHAYKSDCSLKSNTPPNNQVFTLATLSNSKAF